jgi:glyoxylase-like metal-dependent hydrolase (beta-lactamase superfamily II)
MQIIRFDIISIGALDKNRLWNEGAPVRTGHSTTTLIRSGKYNILVDPGLPPQALGARLHERTGLTPDAINIVFLTHFKPDHRRGLPLFPKAKVFLSEMEREYARYNLNRLIEEAPSEDMDRKIIADELHLLDHHTHNAPDKLADNVDLFPLPGYTPGTCGLLITLPTLTVLIASDSVPTQDHFLQGQVLPDCADIKQTQESLGEIYEIADLIIPAHDNLFLNPRNHGM